MVILSSDLQPVAAEFAEKAQEAFLDDNFQLAVDLYTQAIDLTPNDADLYADRAQTHLKLNNFTGTSSFSTGIRNLFVALVFLVFFRDFFFLKKKLCLTEQKRWPMQTEQFGSILRCLRLISVKGA
jgi:hypothetical protein